GRTKVLLERRRLLAPLGADLADEIYLVVGDRVIGEHHQGEQLERRPVFEIGGGMHGNALVERGELAIHDGWSPSEGSDWSDWSMDSGNDRRRKSSWWSSRFSATVSCGVMWVTPARG